jgi:hypothetical protein
LFVAQIHPGSSSLFIFRVGFLRAFILRICSVEIAHADRHDGAVRNGVCQGFGDHAAEAITQKAAELLVEKASRQYGAREKADFFQFNRLLAS